MEMRGQEIIRCPQCGGNKVRVSNITRDLGALTLFCAVTIIGIPLAVIFGFIWLVMKLATKDNKQMVCEECKHRFHVNKTTFEQYKNAIKQNEMSL